MASPRLVKPFLDRSSSTKRASSLSIVRAFTSSSSFLFAISSLPLQAPKLSNSLKSTTKKAGSASGELTPKPSLAAARLARIQSKVTHSKLNLTKELHFQRYPYLAEIKVACYLPSPSSTSTFSSSILPSLTISLGPYSSRFPLQLLKLPLHPSTSISGLLTFTRRANAVYDHVKHLWVEDRNEGETDRLQATTLVVLEEQDMMDLVKGKNGEGEGVGFIEMVEQVREFTGVGKGQLANGEMADETMKGRVICVVLGWSCWEGNADREDRKWREKVVGDLVVKGGCFVQDVATVEEAISFLWTSFGHIAVRRHSRLDHPTPTPPPPPIKVRRTFDTKAPRKGVNSLDTFGLMHQKITRGSEDKSRAITNEFGSLRKLLERYDDEEAGGRAALQELYPVGENGKPQQKKIGPAFSKKVHKIWTSEDSEELV